MVYKIRIPAQTIAYEAFDDLDAVFTLNHQIVRIKFQVYGPDNKAIGGITLRPFDPSEMDFEFNSPDME